MLRFLLLLGLLLPALGRAQTTAGMLPNEHIFLTEGLRGDGFHSIRVIRVFCNVRKTGVEVTFYSATEFVQIDAPTFIPVQLGNEKCTPGKVVQKLAKQGATLPEFLTLPPGSSEPATVPHADATTRWLYVSDHSARTSIEALDPDSLKTAASLQTEPRLIGGLARSLNGDRLYATLWRSTTATPPLPAQIAVINTDTNQIIDRIPLTGDMLPSDPAVSSDGKLLYFADETEGLVVVDLEGRSIIDRIPAARAGAATNRFATLSLSPDGGLICLTDSAGIALLDTRTRTFIARINLTLVKRSLPPAWHPNGSVFYLVDRRGSAISLVGYHTSDLSEASRVPLPDAFDPYNVAIMTHGASIAMDGFLRPSGQPAAGVLIMVDTIRNQVRRTATTTEPTVGALGVVIR